jgi:Zn finger protein HypA/HybF involved in hydrogenase expression
MPCQQHADERRDIAIAGRFHRPECECRDCRSRQSPPIHLTQCLECHRIDHPTEHAELVATQSAKIQRILYGFMLAIVAFNIFAIFAFGTR